MTEKIPKMRRAERGDPMTISRMYMRDICKIDLLSTEEEISLAVTVHGDDQAASDKAKAALIQANLRLVVKIANEYISRGVSKHDLIAEGNIGLMTAAEKFDPAKGVRFSSYAAWWIKQSMQKALADQSRTIRVPIQALETIRKINNLKTKLTSELGYEPSDRDLADYLGINESTVNRLKFAGLQTSSLNAPIKEGESAELKDTVADIDGVIPDQALGANESIDQVLLLLDNLNDREKEVLSMRFGLGGHEPQTLEDISRALGCTRERIRQIQNKALSRLRNLLPESQY